MGKCLVEKFNEKINKEYDDFIEKLKKCEPDEIIDKAYEKSIKLIMKEIMENRDFFDDELKVLLKCDNVIDECYDKWIDMNEDFAEVIESAIDKKIEDLEDEEEELKTMEDLQ